MEKIHAEEFFMEQMRRNLKRVVWILAVLILALVVRLFWIQILGSEDLKRSVISRLYRCRELIPEVSYMTGTGCRW